MRQIGWLLGGIVFGCAYGCWIMAVQAHARWFARRSR